jgi:dTDP-4-dehydrorhamnose reductase
VVAGFCSNPCVPEGVRALKIDLSDGVSTEEQLAQCSPDVIVHLAALTDPDRCETSQESATRVNLEASVEIARFAGRHGCKMVFASTDLVFDGAKGGYTETDEAHPLSIYGTTKLRAEQAVLEACPDAFVFRSSLVYGWGSPVSGTFLSTMVDRLGQGQSMQLFVDQKRNPILVDDLASAVVTAIEQDISGLHHTGGPDVVTRYEFGRLVCEGFGYAEDLLVPIEMRDFAYVAPRPLDSTLDSGKFISATGFRALSLREGLARLRG